MKNLTNITATVCLFTIFLFSCTNKKTMNNENSSTDQNQTMNFKSNEEALSQAKNDLVSILKDNTIKTGIDLQALERSNPETSIDLYEVNFEGLLNPSDSIALEKLSSKSNKLLTPLVDNNNVVTTITTSNNEDKWILNELTNSKLSKDLTEIKSKFAGLTPKITLYEVPNINITVFEVQVEQRKVYFSTNLDNNSISQATSQSDILKTIQERAIIFQRTNGELLKKGPLVK